VSRLAQILADDGSIRNGIAFPSSPVPLIGDLFYRTDGTKTLYIYNGTGWDTMFDGGGAGAIDHGGLVGLTDDDHSIYIKADGTRDFNGDPQIEKNVPLLRWKGSEANAEEFGVFEDTGDFVIAENTGTEGTPVWTDRLRYDKATTAWIFTGGLTTPTIADFTNATHNHADAAGGGVISASSLVSTGTFVTAQFQGDAISTQNFTVQANTLMPFTLNPSNTNAGVLTISETSHNRAGDSSSYSQQFQFHNDGSGAAGGCIVTITWKYIL
jgi:hypothetical protein